MKTGSHTLFEALSKSIEVINLFRLKNQGYGLISLLALVPVFLLISELPAFGQGLTTSAPSATIAKTPALPAVEKEDPSLWKRSLALGLSYTDGNSNTSFLDLSGDIQRDYERNIWEFKARYSFAESDNGGNDERETTKNEIDSKNSYKRLLDDHWYVGMGADFRYDEVSEIDYRATLIPTAGYFIIRDDKVNLSFEAGPSYLFEKVAGEEQDYLAPRVADRFEWKLSPTSKLFQSAELLFDVTNSDNYIVNAEIGIEAAINTTLALVFVVRDAYDNEPAEDRERNDVAVVTSLKLNI